MQCTFHWPPTNAIFTLYEHGGVHEELGDVCESIAEAFGEKNLEELVLEGNFVLYVHGLGLFWPSSSRLKALNGAASHPGGGGGTGR